MDLWDSYIKDVQSGKRIAGRLEKLAVERFQYLCKIPEYRFDTQAVEEKLHIVSNLRHTSGKFYGQPFNILPWQSFFWAWIFGLKYREDDLRVTREVLLSMAKKGGKSEIAGATAVLMTFFDNEQGAQCYSAANSLDQALFCWNAAKTMCKQLRVEDEEFAEVCSIHDSFNNRVIRDLGTDSFFKTISSENKTLDGTNAHFAVIDEFHMAADDSIPKNLKSGMVLRQQPLLMYVTTRGFNPNGELMRLENKHTSLLNGAKDDTTMGLIFAFDQEDVDTFRKYWGQPVEQIDKSFWVKSNPGLGIAPSVRGLETMYTDAINEGISAQTNVMVKNFNIWERQAKTWLGIQHWNQCIKPLDIAELAGLQGFGAMDLSTTWDLTAVGILFPPQNGCPDFRYICRYFCPEDGIKFRARRDKVPYPEWQKAGLLIATPGKTIDHEFIREEIRKFMEVYEVPMWVYDPMFATETAVRLTENGINTNPMKQTSYQFNEPIMWLEKIILSGTLNKGNDPILDWMFGNVAIRKNATGLQMFDKEKSAEKIDGIVALAMCMAGYLDSLAGDEESVYNSPERDSGLLRI